jgi:hypothetical protein
MNIEALKAEHGDIFVFEFSEGAIALRRPSRAAYKAFMAKVAKDQSKIADAQEQLARDCVVHPSKQEFADTIEKFPALPALISAELIALAAGEEVERAKKA